MDKFWIGLFARAFNSIPVVRPQDLQCSGTGTIFSKDDIPLKLYGVNTKFKKELTKRCYIALPNGESVEVVSIISDNEALLKNQFTNDASVTQLTALDKDGKRSGSSYKITPYVDQSGMFNEVVSRLTKNKAVGIFPEGLFYLILGGSHDRPNMLPLKPGVAMMAFETMVCNPESSLVIIPVGLNYFHADRFRSRAVVEYGQPIKIPPDLISLYLSGGTLKRQAVGKLMHTIEESLKGLSLQAPDFESLVVVQAVNRLYCNDRELSIDASLRICRKFAFAFQEMRNHPEIIDLVKSVKHYNSMLNMYAIKDHQVKHTSIGPINALLLLIYRIIQIVLVFIFALPMYLFFFIFRLVLGSPLIYLAHSISRDKMIMAKAGSNVKIHGKDVVSTWMLLTSLVVIPVLWIGYSMLVYAYYVIYYERSLAWCRMIQFFIMYPFLGYATILAGDVGMDIAKSLKPLIVSVAGFFSSSEQLRDLRSNLQNDIERLVKKLGPQIFPGFEDSRHKDIDPDTSHDDDFTGSPERDEWNRLADTIAF